MSGFKDRTSFHKRIRLSNKIRLEYPNRYPVIVEPKKPTDPKITRDKFLIPHIISTVSVFMQFRDHIEMTSPDQSITFYTGNTFIPVTMPISLVYSNYQDDDGFLYITYTTESAFG